MYNATDYVHDYGRVPFSSLPFNDADNLALCGVFYMPVENVVTSEFEKNPEKNIGDACRDLFAMYGNKHVAQGLFLNKDLSKRFVDIKNYPRFADLPITGCKAVFDPDSVVQFAGMTILLPDGTAFVIFRGTDDSFTGWKEDMDILVKGRIPSYDLAIEYLNDVAKTFDGNIIVAGHSKGGNVALYAAMNCSEEIRKRIVKIYNNEGPGFADYTPYGTAEFREILPKYKHIVPSASFVGMLLCHDKYYTVVRSSMHLGPMQHDISTWQLKGCELDVLPGLDILGKINELSFENIHKNFTKDQVDYIYDIVCNVIESSGQKNLLGFSQLLVPSILKMANSWNHIDKSSKKFCRSALKTCGGIIRQTRIAVTSRKSKKAVSV